MELQSFLEKTATFLALTCGELIEGNHETLNGRTDGWRNLNQKEDYIIVLWLFILPFVFFVTERNRIV